MTKDRLHESLPEWEPFRAAVQARHPDHGTWCEAWTVRDVVAHQAGTSEELARVLKAELSGNPVPTRGFEEREAPYRAMSDGELWSAVEQRIDELCEVTAAASSDLGSDAEVSWTGRPMRVAWFAEHMREELVLHRWDLTGDDAVATAALAEPWMTTHSVDAVGRPLLSRGAASLDLPRGSIVEGRLRVAGRDDILVTATSETTEIILVEPEGEATIECDAATRCLFIWGRRPSDATRWRSSVGPIELRRVRTLLSGY